MSADVSRMCQKDATIDLNHGVRIPQLSEPQIFKRRLESVPIITLNRAVAFWAQHS